MFCSEPINQDLGALGLLQEDQSQLETTTLHIEYKTPHWRVVTFNILREIKTFFGHACCHCDKNISLFDLMLKIPWFPE